MIGKYTGRERKESGIPGVPVWAMCEHPMEDFTKSCGNPASWGFLAAWGAVLVCGCHRKLHPTAERLPKAWWKEAMEDDNKIPT